MSWRPFSPSQLLSLHVAGLIALGTVLLALPISAEPGRSISLLNALFTSASGVCVTGLVVLDTPKDLSLFGEIVLMLLIQAGGLGYMTISTFLAVALGQRVTLQERLALQEVLSVPTREGLLRFVATVLKTTLVIELAGALVLGIYWAPRFGAARGAFLGLFHSISAFNNAGFSLFSDNLAGFRGDAVVNLVITSLIILGGLGFLVLSELRRRRQGVPLSLHTKLVLLVTIVLVAGATLAIFLLERHNPASLGALGHAEALLASYFQAVTPRTAGFSTLDIGTLYHPTLFLMIALMFIGASPGGTGGGVKTTTFGIMLVALWTTVRGRSEPVIFRRRLSGETVARAFAVSLIAFLAVNVITGLVLLVEGSGLLDVLFETTSAFGTVGLSMGRRGSSLSLSGHFSWAGKLLMIGMMYLGRVGPLTLAMAIARGRSPAHIRYPEGKVLVG